ncbi:MAG TPA: hypothetical protein VFO65_11530, partial [Acidimicrobiales bacterium]|nr:hypothetical protein [Acidimicrobiales bacterium]
GAGRPLFKLYKANGAQYTPGVDQSSDISRCTVRVRIELVAAPEAGPEPGTLVSDVHLRNRLPGGTGCPQVPLTTVAP